MQLSKKTELWVAMLAIMLVMATFILFIDFGIKSAILEESNKLRLAIEAEEVRRNGQRRAEADANGATNDAPDHPAIPSDVLVVDPAGMEAGGSANGSKAAARSPRARRAKPSGQSSDRAVPGGNEQLGTSTPKGE